MSEPSDPDWPASPERRAALAAIRKYATLGAGASIVVLTAEEAVAKQGHSNGHPGCANSGGKADGCDDDGRPGNGNSQGQGRGRWSNGSTWDRGSSGWD